MKILSLKSCLLLILIIGTNVKAYSYFFQSKNEVAIKEISYFESKDEKLTIKDVIKHPFKKIYSTPYFGLSKSTFWLKIIIENYTTNKDLLFEIQNSSLSLVKFYKIENGKITYSTAGESTPFSLRIFGSPTPLFQLSIPKNSSKIYFAEISSNNIIQLPLLVNSNYSILSLISYNQFLFGIYIGIIFIMFFYNLFIYITVRDSSYLYYVVYIFTIGFTQACLKGYAGKFLWSENTWLIINAQIISIGLSGIFSIIFAFKFLNAKKNAPVFHKLCFLLICGDIIGIIVTLLHYYTLAQQLFQFVNGVASIIVMIYGIIIYQKGYKPALFLNISWSFFLGGVIIYILKDIGILNYNTFTSNSILIGSAIEATLLSFALADKINIYKKEKEESQAEALQALQENARIIREQNVTLERKVEERTNELVISNNDLKETLTELKEAEAQLVEAEKMASLGQLTAGIAHEINNPINFVTSNVGPLRRDVDTLLDAISNIESVGLSDSSITDKQQQIEDYKEEIDFDYLKLEIDNLLNGIHEGATRTADIVKGLKIFSRLDEDDIKKADINEGLASTLIIANNLIGNKIRVIKNFGDIPLIECYPGKLNQVFLNIISNAVFAIHEKYGDSTGGILKITTECDAETLFIKIEDNGTGMSEATKKKIFEPFFTTKNVGVGTGLGMSIVYNTINKHNGQIHINSTEGVGTEFIIQLQLVFKETVSI
jgi:signal transduction histidine kinase